MTRPSDFTKTLAQEAWKLAPTIPGRNPERWRLDAYGWPIIRLLRAASGGLFAYQLDHKIPPVTQEEQTDDWFKSLENCQLLSVRVNKGKGKRIDMTAPQLVAYHHSIKPTKWLMDMSEIICWGDVTNEKGHVIRRSYTVKEAMQRPSIPQYLLPPACADMQNEIPAELIDLLKDKGKYISEIKESTEQLLADDYESENGNLCEAASHTQEQVTVVFSGREIPWTGDISILKDWEEFRKQKETEMLKAIMGASGPEASCLEPEALKQEKYGSKGLAGRTFSWFGGTAISQKLKEWEIFCNQKELQILRLILDTSEDRADLLPAMFEWASRLHALASTSALDQDGIRKGVELLQRLYVIVSKIGFFSPDKTKEDVPTTSLKYLLIQYFLGEMTEMSQQEERALILKVSQGHLKIFINQCKVLELLPEEELEFLRSKKAVANRSQMVRRFKRKTKAEKMIRDLEQIGEKKREVTRFKRKNEAEKKIRDLEQIVDKKRAVCFAVIESAICKAMDLLEKLKLEERRLLAEKARHIKGFHVPARGKKDAD